MTSLRGLKDEIDYLNIRLKEVEERNAGWCRAANEAWEKNTTYENLIKKYLEAYKNKDEFWLNNVSEFFWREIYGEFKFKPYDIRKPEVRYEENKAMEEKYKEWLNA